MSMDIPDDLEINVDNATPWEVQVKLHKFVQELDSQYNFEYGGLIYQHLLSALNQYFKKADND